MPEIAEIETLVRQLRSTIVGKEIVDAYCRQPRMLNLPLDEFRQRVRGRVQAVERRAKHAILAIDGRALWLHLGLNGVVRYLPRPAGEAPPGTCGLLFADGSLLYLDKMFMGQAHLLTEHESQARSQEFGPDPLSPAFTLDRLREILRAHPTLTLKALLMDQRLIAGIGNTYSDEILLVARLHPARRAGTLTPAEQERLYQAIQTVLREAVEAGGTPDYEDLAGQPGRYRLKVHGQERCGLCGGPVERLKFGGRTAYYCPACQGQA